MQKLAKICKNLQFLKYEKTLENTRFSSKFKGFPYGAEGGIRTFYTHSVFNAFLRFDNFLTTFAP
jgi:hypothetical protein